MKKLLLFPTLCFLLFSCGQTDPQLKLRTVQVKYTSNDVDTIIMSDPWLRSNGSLCDYNNRVQATSVRSFKIIK
jgi:hypothetical protein